MRFGSGRSGNVINAGRGRGGVGLGLGGLVVLLVGAFFGVDLSGLAGAGGSAPAQQETTAGPDDETQQWLTGALGDMDAVWGSLFQQAGQDYPEPTLVRFEGQVQSGCGTADSRTGPFYCPADQRLYLDPTFFDELARMGAPGDFAAAYVIAHEVGHHVQNLEGTLEAVDSRKRTLPETQANQLSVATELQADCYAGVWAHHAESQWNTLDDGEVEEGLAAAASVGDDRLQEAAGMEVQPESFSHGSSAQRQEWFGRGFQSGDVGQCDTFARG
jgi:predicted metalloprotease